MRTTLSLVFAACLLSACADPLADVPRLAEVDLAEGDPAAQALPTEAEIAREGFFGTDAAVGEALSDDVAVAEPVATAPARRGLWGLLQPARTPDAPEQPVQSTAVDETPEQPAAESAQAEESAQVVTAATPEPAPRRRGLAGLFGPRVLELEPELPSETRIGATDEIVPDTEEASDNAPVRLASLEPEPTRERRGLFSRLAQPSGGSPAASDMPEVAYGDSLPFGVIARNCAAKRQPLGRKVESVGASGYKLYDSNPRATGMRTYYITGFDDGCPRQLTAAHVLLGAPSFYELLHYGPTGQHLKFGETDRAYEQVKARVCGARKGKPCGSKMKTLERNTFFVNTYPRADDNRSWSELLIHDGRVMATATKSSG